VGKPVGKSDRRTVNVIVDHVANIVPDRVDLARAIASGKTSWT
jgi:hypothetical protein